MSAHGFWLSIERGLRVPKEIDPHNPVNLTPVELTILKMILGGMTNKAIWIERHASHSTVERQIESIHRKFGVHCRIDLVRAAIYWDYVDLITFLEPLRKIPGARV